MRPTSQQRDGRAACERIKGEMLEAVAGLRKVNPEAGDYLEQHLVCDDEAMTFSHTVDPAVFRIARVPPP